MQRLLVMTVIGQDRPGLVETVAALVAEHGGELAGEPHVAFRRPVCGDSARRGSQ